MELLDQSIDLRANNRLLFSKHLHLVHWIVITAVLDAVSTIFFMQVLGPQIEINPIVRMSSLWLGVIIGPIVGKLAQLFAVWALSILAPRFTAWLCILVITLNSLAFLFNLRLVRMNY